jgi:hypothetical protein
VRAAISRREERRGGTIDRAMAAASHLMQRAKRQSVSGKVPVDRLESRPQGAMRREAPRQ